MCQSCASVVYGGRICHEAGCPAAWQDEERVCLFCWAAFRPSDPGQLYCGQACRIADGGGILEIPDVPLDADPLLSDPQLTELWDRVQAALEGKP